MEIKVTPTLVVAFFLLAILTVFGVTQFGGQSSDQTADDICRQDLEVFRKKDETHRKLIKKMEGAEVELREEIEALKKKNKESTATIEKLMTALETATSSETPSAGTDSEAFVLDKPILPCRNRDELAQRINEQGPNFKIGMELGVQRGLYAFTNLNTWKACEKYILVDLWGHLENYHDLANVGNNEQEQIYQEAKNRVAKFGNRTEFMRMLTSDAAKKLKEKHTDATGEIVPFADYIYVDARHDYCGVKEDMELFFPFLKNGGIMAGHDYLEAKEVPGQDWSICGDGTKNDGAVKGAVEEFSIKYGVQLSIIYNEPYQSWFFRKPTNWKKETHYKQFE